MTERRALRTALIVVILVGLVLGVGVAIRTLQGTVSRQCDTIQALRTYVLADTEPLVVPDYVEPGMTRYLKVRDKARREHRDAVLKLIPEARC
jgi:hypothetical protein